MMHASLPSVQHGRCSFTATNRRQTSIASYENHEAAFFRLTGINGWRNTVRNIQVRAAHAQGPSTKLADSSTATTSVTASTGASVFTYLGLGSRNTESVDGDGASASPIDAAASASRAMGIRTGKALLCSFQAARDRLGSSLEQLLFDGAAESMPGWDTTQMAGVLMALGLAHRRPDDAWLNEFWSVSQLKLRECSTGDLAMLSLGLSELQLRPPHAWRAAMLETVLELAQQPADGREGDATGGSDPGEVVDAPSADGNAGVGAAAVEALVSKLRSALQKASPAPVPSSLAGSTAAVAGKQLGASLGKTVGGSTNNPLQQLQQPPTPRQKPTVADWLPANAATRIIAPGSRDALLASPRPVNSAYDMHDVYKADDDIYDSTAAAATSSGVAGILLEPVQAVWGGVRRAAAAVSAAWRRSRSSSELVTVVYNLTAAGIHPEPAWLQSFMQAMQRRLADLSGDDLHCLLLMVAEEVAAAPAGQGAVLEIPPQWQAALYARMDAANWALQGRHLVGCLASIANLGLRPPPPWVRRQLLSLQLALPMLPTESLAQLGALLPTLPLYDAPVAASAMAPDAAATVAGVGVPISAGLPGTGASGSQDAGKMERWLADYRAAVVERRDLMEPAELLSVITGVAAATAAAQIGTKDDAALAQEDNGTAPAPSQLPSGADGVLAANVVAVAAASWLKAAAGGVDGDIDGRRGGPVVSPAEWRHAMVEAVAARLPEATFTALCEAWQVLAEAEARQRQRQLQSGQEQQQQPAQQPQQPLSEDFAELRKLVAGRLATHPAEQQLATSDVAPVLSSLAAAGLPLPAYTLDSLLASTQPLLPGLTSSELVTVALSLVRLSYKPNMAWQAAFCAASRRRLGLMTPGQRCSLLVASASLGLHLPDPWVKDFFAVSERGLGDELDATQQANLLWAASCVVSEPPVAWLEQWESASLPRLRELGPNMLAVVLKAMSTMLYRPSLAWQSAFYRALQRRLFAAGAAQLTWPGSESGFETDAELSGPAGSARTAQREGPGGGPSSDAASTAAGPPLNLTPTASSGAVPSDASAASASSASSLPATSSSSSPSASSSLLSAGTAGSSRSGSQLGASASNPGTATGPLSGSRSSGSRLAASDLGPGATASLGGAIDMTSASVTPEALNSLVYSLASLDLTPPAAWLDELMDAVRCKLSLLSTLDMSVVLAYLVAKGHKPSDDWWESFLESFESRFNSLSATEMASLLIMLNALKVSPTAQWLDAFCTATQVRLSFFQPSQLLQVLSCLHLFRHRPGQAWMSTFTSAVEGQLPRFTPTELARVLMLLDHLNQRPSSGFMLRFYDYSRPGLAQLDTQELVNVAWAVVSCSTLSPDIRWVESLVAAARPRVASLQQPQLRVLVAALGHMQRSAPAESAAGFLAFAREFLVL